METKVLELKKLVLADAVSTEIPDGSYSGNRGGYVVTFSVKNITYEAKLNVGVKCMSCPCTVNVKDGQITIIEY